VDIFSQKEEGGEGGGGMKWMYRLVVSRKLFKPRGERLNPQMRPPYIARLKRKTLEKRVFFLGLSREGRPDWKEDPTSWLRL